MTKVLTINKGDSPSAEQINEVKRAKEMPVTFDDDSPELSEAMLKAFRSSAVQRNRKKNA